MRNRENEAVQANRLPLSALRSLAEGPAGGTSPHVLRRLHGLAIDLDYRQGETVNFDQARREWDLAVDLKAAELVRNGIPPAQAMEKAVRLVQAERSLGRSHGFHRR